MKNHSPAPWELSQTGVAVIAGNINIRQHGGTDKDRARANAALISAAPELLRDLIDASSWLAGIGNWDDQGDADLRRFAATIRKALAGSGCGQEG